MRFLKRYTNNRGSALFMVVSVMTALMMSCMAMYFSVISSRSTQYVVFNQQQSKSTAESISEAVLGAFRENNASFSALITEIQNLKPGEKLSANGNDFASLSSSGTKADDQNLGAYMVEVTKLSENSFDLVVTSSMNGVTNVKHNVFTYSVEEDDSSPAAPTQIFAATGYVPNDVYLEGGVYYADMFYDNELTITDAFDGTDAKVTGDLSAGGSLQNIGGLFPVGKKPVTYAIRKNYISDSNTSVAFPSGVGRSTVLIGKDLILNNGGGFENANIYVLGDMYVFGSGLNDNNCTFFVDGNVYMYGNNGVKSSIRANHDYNFIDWGGTVSKYKPMKIWVNGTQIEKTQTAKKWDDSVTKEGYLDPDSMLAEVKRRTDTNEYYKWNIDDKLPSKTLNFSHGTNPVSTIELKYSTSEKGCEIAGINLANDGRQFNDHAIVIDTGDDPNNVYTIRVKGIHDLDGDGKKETFMWYPYESYDASVRMNVIVKGRGTVVIDVPEGVIYQDMNQVKFMHYGWWLLCGGKVTDKVVNGKTIKIYDTGSGWAAGNMENLLSQFIHINCNSSCKCSYTEKTTSTKCDEHKSTSLIEVHCSVHDVIKTMCPECFPSYVGHGVDHTGDCRMRVGREELDAYLATHASLKSQMLDTEGKLIYPTTNIHLVSVEESAEFRFSQFKSGKGVEGNAFFGYVYAPYMTFKGFGDNSGGGWVRLMGGMTVSDYILDDSYTTIACWPEKMPTDLMSNADKKNKLPGTASKGWKITPHRYG